MASTSGLFDETTKRFGDFALKDYELKIAYLTAHFQRMWTRFNYFVLIEAALIGGRTIFSEGRLGVPGAIFGACLSFVWYLMGSEDRYLVQLYRAHVQEAGDLLGSALWRIEGGHYRPVGDLSGANKIVEGSMSGWRLEAISTTRLASLIPLLVTLVWLGMLLLKLR